MRELSLELVIIPGVVLGTRAVFDLVMLSLASGSIDKGTIKLPMGTTKHQAMHAIYLGYVTELVSVVFVMFGLYIISRSVDTSKLSVLGVVLWYFLTFSGIDALNKMLFKVSVYVKNWFHQ